MFQEPSSFSTTLDVQSFVGSYFLYLSYNLALILDAVNMFLSLLCVFPVQFFAWMQTAVRIVLIIHSICF